MLELTGRWLSYGFDKMCFAMLKPSLINNAVPECAVSKSLVLSQFLFLHFFSFICHCFSDIFCGKSVQQKKKRIKRNIKTKMQPILLSF